MDKQQVMMLASLPAQSIKNKLDALDKAYHITEDRQIRQSMLLYMDELKLELEKRGYNDKSI